MKLTPKQARFCEEYIVDLNGTQAAIRAGYSAKTATETAARLLIYVNVQANIAKLQQARSERTQIEADQVINEFGSIAFGSLKGLIEIKDGKLTITDSTKWTPQQWAYIKDVKKTSDSVSITTHSKTSALESLGKHLGMFSDINLAIATLEKYGIQPPIHPDGSWIMSEKP